MSVKIRPYRRGGWEADVRVTAPNGRDLRVRKKAPCSSRSAAQRWAESVERRLLLTATTPTRKEAPTLQEFAPRFVEGYARANRQKPSGIAGKETILRIHLIPQLGSRRLDAITNEDVQRLKVHLAERAAKTVNNVLTVLNTLLRVAVEWDVIERVPCAIRLLPTPLGQPRFHDFDAFERLVAAARATEGRAYVLVLLGGEAGLRAGEIMALEWSDIDFTKGQVCVQRSDWKGHVTSPKGGRLRYVPLTQRLAAALKAQRHLQSPRVLCEADGRPLSQKVVQCLVRRAARRAQVRDGVHMLRHTFCSHLAMKGAPTRAIQELAGHKDLSTTQRYMHLSPAATFSAIRLLDAPGPKGGRGDILETGTAGE
jgi:integrase